MLAIFVVALAARASVATDFDTCDNGPAPSKLAVTDCEKQPCTFYTGKNIDMDVNFEVDHDVSKLTPDVKLAALGELIDYPLPDSDGCKALVAASCPIEDGESVTYRLQMTIPAIHIQANWNVTFTLTDQSSKILSCFKLRGIAASSQDLIL